VELATSHRRLAQRKLCESVIIMSCLRVMKFSERFSINEPSTLRSWRLRRENGAMNPRRTWSTFLVECVWASHQHLNDVEQLICEGRPDVMVVDRLMFGALRGRMRTLASPILTAAQEAFEDEFDSTDLHPAAVLYLERANDDLAAQDDKVIVARLPVGAGIPIAGSSKAMRHCAKLPRFEH